MLIPDTDERVVVLTERTCQGLGCDRLLVALRGVALDVPDRMSELSLLQTSRLSLTPLLTGWLALCWWATGVCESRDARQRIPPKVSWTWSRLLIERRSQISELLCKGKHYF